MLPDYNMFIDMLALVKFVQRQRRLNIESSIIMGACGAVIVSLVCFDVFQSIILPRATARRLRVAPIFIGMILWSIYRSIAEKASSFVEEFVVQSICTISFCEFAKCLVIAFDFWVCISDIGNR